MDNQDTQFTYEVRIPKNATPEEIDKFMKEFVKKFNNRKGTKQDDEKKS